jgi:hypothetical protein
MENNNMTAVEWLQNELVGLDTAFSYCTFNDKLKKAKQMEKEQKIEFAKHCLDRALDLDIRTAFFNIEEYYNETYGKDSNDSNA